MIDEKKGGAVVWWRRLGPLGTLPELLLSAPVAGQHQNAYSALIDTLAPEV